MPYFARALCGGASAKVQAPKSTTHGCFLAAHSGDPVAPLLQCGFVCGPVLGELLEVFAGCVGRSVFGEVWENEARGAVAYESNVPVEVGDMVWV